MMRAKRKGRRLAKRQGRSALYRRRRRRGGERLSQLCGWVSRRGEVSKGPSVFLLFFVLLVPSFRSNYCCYCCCCCLSCLSGGRSLCPARPHRTRAGLLCIGGLVCAPLLHALRFPLLLLRGALFYVNSTIPVPYCMARVGTYALLASSWPLPCVFVRHLELCASLYQCRFVHMARLACPAVLVRHWQRRVGAEERCI